jgi:hypothetical protein
MATKFKKGEEVKVASVVPEGPVEALRMDDEGNFFYLISWTDAQGVTQSRWFAEADLVAA